MREVANLLANLPGVLRPAVRIVQVAENHGSKASVTVILRGLGPLQTRFGSFWHLHFEVSDRWVDYHVLAKAHLSQGGELCFRQPGTLLLRIDSGCVTGQLFGDLTCECRDQLEKAMQMIQEAGEGLVISIPRQDGRGMGLDFKLATLLLQKEFGLDTCEAAGIVNGSSDIDQRTYSGVVAILKVLGISESTRLQVLTNNPRKLGILVENGFDVSQRVGLVIPPTSYTLHHLEAKRSKLDHVL
jgi:GTP cyclohydrolase II